MIKKLGKNCKCFHENFNIFFLGLNKGVSGLQAKPQALHIERSPLFEKHGIR
jgi:hypothetical protein